MKIKKKESDLKYWMIFLFAFVFLVLLFQMFYFYSLKKNKKSNGIRIEVKQEVKEETDKKEVLPLLEKYDVFNNQLESMHLFGYLYKEKAYSLDTVTNKAKIYIALANINFVDNKNLIDEKDNVVIPRKMVEDKIKELFGKNITYEDESLTEEKHDCRMAYFGYDPSKQVYYLNAFGHNTAAYYNIVKTNILTAKKVENKLEIEVAMYKRVANKEGYIIYKDMDSKEILTTLKLQEQEEIFTKYKEELQKYKYTFVKEKENYIFSKIEKIK